MQKKETMGGKLGKKKFNTNWNKKRFKLKQYIFVLFNYEMFLLN